MTKTFTVPPHIRNVQGFGMGGAQNITLPPPPPSLRIDLDREHKETAPRPGMVKGKHTWKDDRVLRSADKRSDKG